MGAGYAWGQQSAPGPTAHTVLDVAVTDRGGQPVLDLGPSDFTVAAGTDSSGVTAFAAVDAISGATRTAPPLPLPVKIDPGEVHRAFVVIADDAGIAANDAADLRAALLQFVDGQLAPRDTVAVFRTSDGASALERLTSDKTVMRAAIQKIAFNPADVQPSTPGWQPILPVVVGGLRAVEGRKAVVLLSRRAPQTCASGLVQSLANQGAARIYVVHEGGTAAAPACFQELAAGTGGLELSSDIAAALRRVAADQKDYYLLGVKPPPGAAAPMPVHVSRPGLEVRARQRPAGRHVEPLFREPTSPQIELRRSMASPLEAGTMRVRLWAGFRRTAVNSILELPLLVDGRDISFTHRLNGKNEASLDLQVRVFDSAGGVVEDQSNTANISATDEEYRRIADEGLPLALRVTAARPGVFQVYAGVRDATSSNTGLCHRLVEVPDVSKGDLLVSGIRLYPAASANVSDEAQALDAVKRVFRPGQQIAYNCAIYNPQPDEHNTAHVEVRTMMYAEGHAVFRGGATQVTSPNMIRNSWLTLRGTFEVGEYTAPGEFVFQVLVADKVKPRTASQWIGFTLK